METKSTAPVRYGVVGLGRAGWDIHVAQLRPRNDAVIVAAADPLPERREEASSEFDCHTCEGLDGILAQDDVDVVVLATPSAGHPEECIRCFRAGKHVVVEKPLAGNTAEADRVLAAAKDAGRELFINQTRRYGAFFQNVRDVLASGRIGEVFLLRIFAAGSFIRRRDWQMLREFGGGELANTGSHMLDLALQFVGSPVTEVFSDLRHIAGAGDAEDHVKVLLRTQGGATIDMEISRAEALGDITFPLWTICGTTGTIVSNEKTTTVRWFDPAEAPAIEVDRGAAAGRQYGTDDVLPWQEESLEAEDAPTVEELYENVCNVLRRGGTKVCSPESVRDMIAVMDRIREGTGFEDA